VKFDEAIYKMSCPETPERMRAATDGQRENIKASSIELWRKHNKHRMGCEAQVIENAYSLPLFGGRF